MSQTNRVRRNQYVIGLLAVSAVCLAVANIQLAPTALAETSVSNDQYALSTGRTTRGDEALYVLDRQKNMIAIFTWDPGRRTMAVRDVRSLDLMVQPPAR